MPRHQLHRRGTDEEVRLQIEANAERYRHWGAAQLRQSGLTEDIDFDLTLFAILDWEHADTLENSTLWEVGRRLTNVVPFYRKPMIDLLRDRIAKTKAGLQNAPMLTQSELSHPGFVPKNSREREMVSRQQCFDIHRCCVSFSIGWSSGAARFSSCCICRRC